MKNREGEVAQDALFLSGTHQDAEKFGTQIMHASFLPLVRRQLRVGIWLGPERHLQPNGLGPRAAHFFHLRSIMPLCQERLQDFRVGHYRAEGKNMPQMDRRNRLDLIGPVLL
jgi:hypothetical protein